LISPIQTDNLFSLFRVFSLQIQSVQLEMYWRSLDFMWQKI